MNTSVEPRSGDPTSRPRRARFGFTLIELLLVVSLMMIAVAFVTARMDSLLPATKMEACARVLAADWGNARASAIAQGLPYLIEYDIRNNQYRIGTPYRADGGLATDDTNRVFLTWTPMPEGVEIKEVLMGNQVARGGTQRIEIKPNGNTTEHVVHLHRDLPADDFYFVVRGLTGFVQFFDRNYTPDIATEGDFP